MPSLELAAGRLRVSYPDSYGVAPEHSAAVPPRPGQRSGDPGSTEPRQPADNVSATLLEAFATQSLELVAPLELMPTTPAMPAMPAMPATPAMPAMPATAAMPATPAMPAMPATPAGSSALRSPRRSQPGKVRLELDLARGENAVVLLEQDGFFSWHLPTGHDSPPTTSAPRQGQPPTAQVGAGPPPSGVARFEIDVRPVATARPVARARSVRGPFGDFVIGGLKAYVLKFVAGFVPGALMSFLERNTRPGLVLMTGNDVASWPKVDNLSQVRLRDTRPVRILLFIHGTFASTVGDYGVLTSTAPGKKFLKTAGHSYDAIIGFDHQTLSRDPLENAIDLLARLETKHLAFTPTIDVVSYSRGGLVARSLIEYLLPSSTWPANVGKVVFVGATNAGTKLAEPENWKDFADLYTNLAAGTARTIGLGAGKSPRPEILGGLVKGVGAFVKYLASTAVTDGGIPGLAAMEPDGAFIRRINRTQPGQPVAGTPWYVISSDFEASLMAQDDRPPALPRELVAKLADGLVDKLMGAANDLVVDTASMAAVDLPSGGGFIKESLDFGTNGVVHHLNYFIQPQVCRAMTDWLERS